MGSIRLRCDDAADRDRHPGVHRNAVLTLVVVALSACGSNGDVGGGSSGPTVAATATDALGAAAICERLSVDWVAAVTGLDVTRAVPDDSATPQCAYEYNNATGAVSNLTVASMRPEDVGGLTASEAYDFVAKINGSVAGDGAEIQEVSAGDLAVQISGSAVQLGVVQVGDRVLTLIIPGADVAPDAGEQLIATMATTLR